MYPSRLALSCFEIVFDIQGTNKRTFQKGQGSTFSETTLKNLGVNTSAKITLNLKYDLDHKPKNSFDLLIPKACTNSITVNDLGPKAYILQIDSDVTNSV